MLKTGILFPLGLGFLAFGAYEYSQHGLTEHVALLLFMGTLNTLYTAAKSLRSSGR
jgi:hypothetical protein